MAPTPTTIHLPNGQCVTVTHVFGGFSFRSNQLDVHHSAFPPGWTVILQTEDEETETEERWHRKSKVGSLRGNSEEQLASDMGQAHLASTHRFIKPTLNRDGLFLSSISIPSSADFQAAKSPTRQIAMMLWATLYWYFHKEEPSPHIVTEASQLTPEAGRPKADWRVKIKREGILKGKNMIQKLERMGLVTSEESYVGIDTDTKHPTGWQEMFVSRRAFWQIDARIFLFSLSPANHSPYPTGSPYSSRPSSPARNDGQSSPRGELSRMSLDHDHAGIASPGGPFNSGSHLPTYFPPGPAQYVYTNHIRHPIRPKPPRQGETFYSRYIPSVDQWLSFRVPTLSNKPCPTYGHSAPGSSILTSHPGTVSMPTLPTLAAFAGGNSDTEILNRWMNDPRVNAAWGCAGPTPVQKKFLQDGLTSRHSFPVIGCWDGKPFGYFEVYWVKEDKLGRLLGGDVGYFARGLHVLVGEQEFRGPHRVKIWLSALVHYCWLADPRTETVVLEPRVDNEKFINYLIECGFYRQGEVTFPHKQSAVMKVQRDTWEAPKI